MSLLALVFIVNSQEYSNTVPIAHTLSFVWIARSARKRFYAKTVFYSLTNMFIFGVNSLFFISTIHRQ